MPNKRLAKRFPRLGRISVGFQNAKPKKKKPDELQPYPVRSKTFVIHSDDQAALEIWQKHCGGKIKTSPLDDEKLYLQTELTALPIVLAPGPLDLVLSSWMEAWASSGLVRKCDGNTCVLHRLAPVGDEKVGSLSTEEIFCPCQDDGLTGDDACKPVVRLSVLPAEFALELGVGVWVVTSGGWNTNTELVNDLEFINSLVGLRPGMRLMLSVEQVPSSHGPVPKMSVTLDGSIKEALALPPATDGPMLQLHAGELPELDAATSDGAIGRFVDKDDDDEPAEAELVETPQVAAAGGAKPAAATDSRPVSPPDGHDNPPQEEAPEATPVAVIAGIPVHRAPGAPHHPADAPTQLRTGLQLRKLTEICDTHQLDIRDAQQIFEAAYGFKMDVGTKLQVQSFTDYLKRVLEVRGAAPVEQGTLA